MDATKERLRGFLVDEGHWYATPEELGEDLPIISTILDSVGLVNLVAMVEDEFGSRCGTRTSTSRTSAPSRASPRTSSARRARPGTRFRAAPPFGSA